MKLFDRLFRRQKADRVYVYIGGEPTPVPPCPVHGRDCGRVPNPFVGPGWLQTYQPCPVWEATIARAEFGQTHEYFWNPTTEDFDLHPRRQ